MFEKKFRVVIMKSVKSQDKVGECYFELEGDGG
jgi:hypothetical protein